MSVSPETTARIASITSDVGPSFISAALAAVEPFDAVVDSGQTEVSVRSAGSRERVESHTVIPDGEPQDALVGASGDPDGPGVTVGDGVGDEFADDCEDGMDGGVVEKGAVDVEADRKGDLFFEFLDCPSYRTVEDLLSRRVIAEVEKAVPELPAAGLQHLIGRRELRIGGRLVPVALGGGDLIGDAGQRL